MAPASPTTRIALLGPLQNSTAAPVGRRRAEPSGTLVEHRWLAAAFLLGMTAELVVTAGLGIALPDIAGSFGASPDETSWVMTLYLAGFTVAMPLTPFLCDRLGQRRYVGISMLLYLVATALCACSTSLPMLLVMRTVAGFAGAPFLVRYVVMARTTLEGNSRRLALLLAVPVFVVRGFAPVAAGYLTESYSWRLVFLLAMPFVGLAMVALCLSREIWPARHRRLPDPAGLLLLVCGLGGFCVLVSRGEVEDWFGDRVMAVLAVVAIVALPVFVWHQHRDGNHRHLLRLGSLNHRGVLPGLVYAALFGFALQGGVYLLPQFLRSVGRNDAISAGWMFGLDNMATAAALLCVALAMFRYPSRKWLVTAGGLFAASMLLFAFRQTTATSNENLYLPLVLRGVAMAAAFLPLPDVMFRDVAGASFGRLAEARALYYTVRQLGGVAGVAVLARLLDVGESHHSTHLAEHLTALDLQARATLGQVGQGLAAHGLIPAQAARGAQLIVYRLLAREAAVLAFRDIFMVLAVVGVAMCVVATLFPKVVAPGAKHMMKGSSDPMIANFVAEPAAAGSTGGSPAPHPVEPVRPHRLKKDRLRTGRLALAGIVAFTLVGTAGVASYFWLPTWRGVEWTNDAYVDGHVVYAAPQVAGRVAAVLVDDNQPVEAGQLLVKIDASDYDAKLLQARAARTQAEGQLRQARAQLLVARLTASQLHVQIRVAEANAVKANADLTRYRLLSTEALPKLTLDTATAAADATAAQRDAAKQTASGADAQIGVAEATITSAESAVEAAKAAEAQAQLNLSYCELRSPMAGFVTRKTVEVGNYAATGQPLLIIVPRKVYVTANFKETQLDAMRVGQPVTVTVDAYPGVPFTGHVQSLMAGTGSAFSLLPPENATGNFVKVVQRVPVKIVLDGDNDDPVHRLAPGMSAVPEVHVRADPSPASR